MTTFAVVECNICSACLILNESDYESPDAEIRCPMCEKPQYKKQFQVITKTDDQDTASKRRRKYLEGSEPLDGFTPASSESLDSEESARVPTRESLNSPETEATPPVSTEATESSDTEAIDTTDTTVTDTSGTDTSNQSDTNTVESVDNDATSPRDTNATGLPTGQPIEGERRIPEVRRALQNSASLTPSLELRKQYEDAIAGLFQTDLQLLNPYEVAQREPLDFTCVGRWEDLDRSTQQELKNPHLTSEEISSLPDSIDLPVPVPDDAGLTPTTQQVNGETHTIAGHNTISKVWMDLVENPEIQRYFLCAARNAVVNRPAGERYILLTAVGITDTPGRCIRSLINDLEWKPAIARQKAAFLLDLLPGDEDFPHPIQNILGMARLFRFATHNDDFPDDEEVEIPTVVVNLDYEAFTALDHKQRTDVCKLLTRLSKSMDLRLVTTLNTIAYLKKKHRDDLPGVSDWEIGHRGPRLAEALNEFDAESTEVAILNAISQEPDDTLSYSTLYKRPHTRDISKSRVRQCISTLQENGLVETFGTQADKHVELLSAGREFLTRVDDVESSTPNTSRHKREDSINKDKKRDAVADSSKQSRASDNKGEDPAQQRKAASSSSPETSPDAVPRGFSETSSEGTSTSLCEDSTEAVSDDFHETSSETASNTAETTSRYTTEYLSKSDQVAIAACGVEHGSVTIVDDDIEDVESTTQFIAVDTDRREIIVSGHATNPLDYTVGISVALTHPKFIHEVLTDDLIETVRTDVRPAILRNARQIGYATNDALADPERFRELLIEWGENIKDLTQRNRNQSGDAEADGEIDLTAEICKQAHGLAGSIVHFLDEAGFDMIRDIRVPAGVNSSKLDALAKSIAHSLLIQSQYKGFSAFRQLYEDRESYREESFTVDVDTTDPTGTVIGSMVIRGRSATRLYPRLVDKLSSYVPHEDAPEFTIPITIREPTRETVAVAAKRALRGKNIRLTDDAVSVLDAVVDSPFGVVQALSYLDTERAPRDIDAADLRYALQHLAVDDVLSGLPRSVGAIMMALFEADEPISQAELAERADVTGQTIRNHEDALVHSGLVQVTETASGRKRWRASLAFCYEDGQAVFPESCVRSLASVVGEMIESADCRCECSGDCVNALYEGELSDLSESCSVARWGRVCAALTDSQVPHNRDRMLDRLTMGVEQNHESVERKQITLEKAVQKKEVEAEE